MQKMCYDFSAYVNDWGIYELDNDNTKQLAILGNLHKQEARLRAMIYCALKIGDELTIEQASNNYEQFKTQYGELAHVAFQVNRASYQRMVRLKKRVAEAIITGNAIFLSLTFNNATLNNTTPKQRRTIVSRFLKANSTNYVANIDYGKLHGREHYHAILFGKYINLSQWQKYGGKKLKHCGHGTMDIIKLAKYVNKLTNHAIKETTRTPRIIYSRHIYQ